MKEKVTSVDYRAVSFAPANKSDIAYATTILDKTHLTHVHDHCPAEIS